VNFDWQNIAVFFIVAAALCYVGRRAYFRLRSLISARREASSCATGCGKCGDESISIAPAMGKTLIQIKRQPSRRS
jgi:hypothetical protein